MDENTEDREDFAYQLARKVKEKELELERMADLMRKNTFQHTQTLKELEAELESERQRNRENAEIYAIQEKTLLETLEKTNNELLDLRFEAQKFAKYKPCSEEGGEFLSYEELLLKLHETNTQFLSFKDGAINAMIEKDKEIEELSNRLSATSPEMLDDLLKEREQLLQERQDFQRKLESMEQELERSMYECEERRKNLENEVSEQVSLKVKELLEANKSSESSLMDELRKSDEKIQHLESQSKELARKLRESEEKLSEFSLLSQRKSEDFLQTRGESLEKELQKHEKTVEELRRVHLAEISSQESLIKSLQSESQDLARRLDVALQEKQRLLETHTVLKLKLEGYDERFVEEKRDFEEKLRQVLKTSEAEKEKLEQEVHHLRDEANKNRNYFPQSMNNLMNLKEDMEVFNNFLDEGPPQNLALIIPSRKELAQGENSAEREKLVEELKEEVRNNRESEISAWERELAQEKELFRSLREEKVKENEENAREIQEKTRIIEEKTKEIQEKTRIIEEKTKEIQEKISIIEEKNREIAQFSLKLREISATHEKELDQLRETCKISAQKSQETALFSSEELKREKVRLELAITSLKQGFSEERAFFQAELQKSEAETIDAKLKLAEVALDKEFLQMKLKKIDKELKNKGILIKI